MGKWINRGLKSLIHNYSSVIHLKRQGTRSINSSTKTQNLKFSVFLKTKSLEDGLRDSIAIKWKHVISLEIHIYTWIQVPESLPEEIACLSLHAGFLVSDLHLVDAAPHSIEICDTLLMSVVKDAMSHGICWLLWQPPCYCGQFLRWPDLWLLVNERRKNHLCLVHEKANRPMEKSSWTLDGLNKFNDEMM